MDDSESGIKERVKALLEELVTYQPGWEDLSTMDIHFRNGLGETPLHIAAIRGDAQAVGDLLALGANPNIRGEHGFTALHEAVLQEHVEVVRLLLEHGASRTEQNDWGQTAADIARLHKCDEILASLES